VLSDALAKAAGVPFMKAATCTLSVILPTYNEAQNIPLLTKRLEAALADIDYEIIVVDDNSPDRTWKTAENLAERNPRIRVLRRFDERGLSSAVLTGMSIAGGEVFAVMDADLQHDEAILPGMVAAIREENCDVAIGSRGAPGGDYGTWSKRRRLMSWGAAAAARLVLPIKITDPMSGFFAIDRKVYYEVSEEINPRGFKILLEFIGRGRKMRTQEIGYSFRNRVHGETKLSPSVVRNYFVALYDLRFGRYLPASFVLYGAVGASGVVINVAGFKIGELFGLPHIVTGISPYIDPIYLAAPFGYQLAIFWNFFLNNYITFWERRRTGARILLALLVFELISLFGLFVHTATFQLLHVNGLFVGILAEAWREMLNVALATIVAMVSNYFLNLHITWGAR